MYSKFIIKTLGLPEDSIIQFYLMTVGMEYPKLGHIKYENFTNLFKSWRKYYRIILVAKQ